MDYIIKDGELYHHGVKGMKWGVRKDQNKNTTSSKVSQKQLYEELTDGVKNDSLDKILKKYRKDLAPSIDKVKDIVRRMYDDTLDYTEGDPYWQIDKATIPTAEKLLGKYANKKISDKYGDPIKAKYYLARLIDAAGSGEATDEYDREHSELAHHGVKGQRWGVRRFQNSDGSLTAAGKKRLTRKQKKTLEKARKAKRAKAEAAKKAKQEQEEFEAGKKKAIESGSAQDVLKYKGKLTQQELQTAFNRLNLERSIADISARGNANNKSKIEKITDKLQKAKTLADKGIDAWNVTAKILNSTTDSDLPVIDGTKKKDKAINKAREKLIKSGSIEDIAKNLGKFDTKEIEAINKRLSFESSIQKKLDALKANDTPVESSNTTKSAAVGKKYILKRYPWELN